MDVFVIPIGPDRYELYCEQPAAADEPIDPGTGLIAKLRRWFRGLVRDAEERQRNPEDATAAKSWRAKWQDRGMAWVAERIAEQRLLWNLRTEREVAAAHPDDMTFNQVHALIRETLQRDYDRHRRWMFIDGFWFIVTFIVGFPIFVIIPGVANLPALYFGFRTIGHFLSMHGAGNGLRRVTWSGRACPPLSELRELAVQDEHVRAERLRDVAVRLRLEDLPRFFDRVAIPR